MRLFRLLALGAVVAIGAACSKDTDGELTSQPPLAAVRYVNLVPDTIGLDFRVVDIIGYAPNAIAATFRTGGFPAGSAPGASLPFPPPHQPVRAGTRTIRVFLSHYHPDTGSVQVLPEFQATFAEGLYYTVYLHGYARTGQTPAITATVVQDNPVDPGATNFSIRVVHLAPTLAPTLGAGAVDVFVDTLAAGDPTSVATFPNVAIGSVSNYVNMPARVAVGAVPALNYRAVVAATGTNTPNFLADIPNGVVGTSTANPIAGDLVAGTSITAVIVPPSVAGSLATPFATPSVIYLIDRQPPRTAP